MDSYDTPSACAAIEEFLEVISNWYIRRNKDRFWESINGDSPWNDMSLDKRQAYQTLYTVIILLSSYSASLLPCITEKIYLELTKPAFN
jgi:isoleucyl-tRNA synthetase